MDEEHRQYFRDIGQKGGKKRAANMTPEKRSASARKAAKAAVRKRRQKAAK